MSNAWPVNPIFPDPLARGPRLTRGAQGSPERLYPAPPRLKGAMVGVICRDTRHLHLNLAQQLTYFPASPLLSISWAHGDMPMHFQSLHSDTGWQCAPSNIVLVGSQMKPSVAWSPLARRAGMAVFTADAVRDIFDLQPLDLNDQILDAQKVLGQRWQSLLDDLIASPSDALTLQILESHLAPRLRELRGMQSVADSVRNQGRYWVEQLLLQARKWRGEYSERQVERKIKALSGRSLRQWQALVKAEGAFETVSDQVNAAKPVDWLQLALSEGFSDQAHFNRVTKELTGFSPSEVVKRYLEDESFWLYRLWT